MKLLVTNIQRFCLHDGPGIRTTVFLKGCNLHCPWCCNPENISFQPQLYYQQKKCIAAKGKCCYGRCPLAGHDVTPEKIQALGGSDMRRCKSGAIGVYGERRTGAELFGQLMKDACFWGDDGGVTFSGGESLLQWEGLQGLLARLKEAGVHLCVETALFIPRDIVVQALPYLDLWIVDVKLLDAARVREILGGDINVYLQNLDILADSGKDVWLRHPKIAGHTDDADTENAIHRLLERYASFPYQVLEEHHLGDEKYGTLGINKDMAR